MLDALLASTRKRLDAARAKLPEAELRARAAGAPPARDFLSALRAGAPVALLAEIKRASPSKGSLNLGLRAGHFARVYEEAGAHAISVLTEPEFFKGSLQDLAEARTETEVPLLRKDFLLEPYQLAEARAHGADAALLIVRALGPEGLRRMAGEARALGLFPLVEVHDERELDLALGVEAGAVGVNHRDLVTFQVDRDLTARLAPRVPAGVLLVAESGVSTRADVLRYGQLGAHAVLVGEAIVTSDDPGRKIRQLLG
ncbi:MAG: indole-3-glycerol phosphate synthase TrpC [Planctomycetes bacterium]|nr:indole-3-glycerol phosphate synthase TrpC [Planctomycetota bacterium]